MRRLARICLFRKASIKRNRAIFEATTSCCLELSCYSKYTTYTIGHHQSIFDATNPYAAHQVTSRRLSYSVTANIDDAESSQTDVACADTSNNTPACHLSDPLINPGTPLPPPLSKPKFSFRGRVLPSNLTAFDSIEGKQRFVYALQNNCAESYFPLSQQFLNQMDPAYCGVTTLVLILNALAIDPNVRWRGGWRWYGDEQMLLERCCIEKERVEREGITMEQFCGLARCQGVNVSLKRPIRDKDKLVTRPKPSRGYDINEFRNDILTAVNRPPKTQRETDLDVTTNSDSRDSRESDIENQGYFLVTSFGRSSLSQTGDGHFSPIAAYHEPSDSCLVLDVARFKYAPYWVKVADLFDAMIPEDKATGQPRGWLLMYPPTKRKRGPNRSFTVEEIEGKRPAACVPLAGSQDPLCAMEKIKVDYCSVNDKK